LPRRCGCIEAERADSRVRQFLNRVLSSDAASFLECDLIEFEPGSESTPQRRDRPPSPRTPAKKASTVIFLANSTCEIRRKRDYHIISKESAAERQERTRAISASVTFGTARIATAVLNLSSCALPKHSMKGIRSRDEFFPSLLVVANLCLD
jgi:hypothetical protein